MKAWSKYIIFTVVLLPLFTQEIYATTLDDKCVVNVLNRTIQVSADGGWALPNVPANMGQIRARATCILDDGRTVSGQSDYFNVVINDVSKVGEIKFEKLDPIPTIMNFSSSQSLSLNTIDETFQLSVTGFYADNSVKNLTAADTGVNYSSTNSNIVSVDSGGLITAKANGVALISARKDGVLASRRVEVSIGGDLDGDGIPDDVERALGLNPNDPIDALEDQDNDGLSAIEEYQIGTNIFNADTDGDGIADKEELEFGNNGFITNPLLADSDGDGISDSLEILGGSNPNDASSGDLSSYLDYIEVSPSSLLLTYNAIDGEAAGQLSVTGYMLDGSPIDLTQKSFGTRYSSADLETASFGLTDGQIFAGQSGVTNITITNGSKSFVVDVAVTQFTPVALATIDIPGYANNVDVQGDLAYVAAGGAGLQVIDVSDHSAPEVIASLDTSGTAIDVKVLGNIAYLADGTSGLQIIDITDPSQPVLLANVDTAGVAQDLVVQDDFVFIADGRSGIKVINIADTAKPFSVGYSDLITNVKGIAVEGNRMVAVGSSSLALFDIEDATNPLWLTAINIGEVKDVVIDRGYVYVAAYSTGYRVYKINEENQLIFKGGDSAIAPRDVAATDGFVFFAEQLFPNVVAYVNIKDPETPFFQDTIDLSMLGDYAGTGIAIDANHTFITGKYNVAATDYEATGDTKLFIAQYRELSDANGIAPTITLTKPVQDGATVEGARLTLAANAKDDIAVARVKFYVNNIKVGEDSTFPYSIPYSVAQNTENIMIRADAVDLAGTTTKSSLVILNVQNDKDGDGLGDQEEVDTWLTDATKFDTDGDGLSDGEEVARATNPNDADSDGDGLLDGQEVENGTDPNNPDITAPVITFTQPASDATEVAQNSSIIISFSEALSKKYISANEVSVLEGGIVPITGVFQLIGGNQQLVFIPSTLLKEYTSYTVKVQGVKDTAGNALEQAYQFDFVTGKTFDNVIPRINTIYPKGSSVNVPVNAAVTLVMSEPIDPETITNYSFYVLDTTTGFKIDGLTDIKADSQTIIFTPNVAFLVGRTYKVKTRRAIKDLFGNALNNSEYSFTTAFEADGLAPVISSMSLQEGQTEVPLNTKLNIRFNEAINSYSIKNVKLLKNNSEVQVNRTISRDLSLFSLIPKVNLDENTAYTLLIDGISDPSGNLLSQIFRINFTTGTDVDTQAGTISNYSPYDGAVDVALNSTVIVYMSEPIDATSITPRSVQLYNITESRTVNGVVSVSESGRRLQFSPESDLNAGHKYRVHISLNRAYLLDLVGNKVGHNNISTFTTGEVRDDEVPIYVSSNISTGLSDVPVNAPLQVVFNEALGPHCINSNTVVLSGGQNTINGSVSLNSNRTEITFTPNELLAANTDYRLLVENSCDATGNIFSGEVLSFTTAMTVNEDNTAPQIVSIVPATGSNDVLVTSEIVVTFTEALDARDLESLARIYTAEGDISGDYTLTESVLRFVPDNPFPGSTVINIQLSNFKDLVGNNGCCGNYSFTTEAEFDVKAPTVTMISPTDGAMDIGINTPVVLTFSESLNANTINNNHFKLYGDGNIITPNVERSGDGKTVILRGTWPAGKTLSVIVTKDVKDLSNNTLGDYVSLFNTAVVNTDTTRPTVSRLYPINGASNVPSVKDIVIYTSEVMNESTLAKAFHVAVNGVLVDGTLSVSGSGQAITFTALNVIAEGSLVQVSLDSNAQDSQGNAMVHYQGSFSMAATSLRPSATAYIPAYGATGVVLNPKIQVLYNQEMDENTITDSSITLRKADVYSRGDGEVLSIRVSLEQDKRTVTIEPSALLLADTYYYVSLGGSIKAVDGNNQRWLKEFGFTTGINAVEDLQRPMVLAMSPATGMTNVPLNPRYHVKFDEPINPLSFGQRQDVNVSFGADNKKVFYTRYTPLAVDVEHTETLMMLTDIAGNKVVEHSENFTTGSSIDIIAPDYQSHIPYSNSVVVINSPIIWKMSEALDPLSVHGSVYLRDMGVPLKYVYGNSTLGNDGKTIYWLPSESLLRGKLYRAHLRGITDLSGNNISKTATFNFNTALEDDIVIPEIIDASIQDGLTGVPTNTRIRIQFNKVVSDLSFTNINVMVLGEMQAISFSLDPAGTLLTLTPLTLLPANSQVSIKVEGVKDLASKVQANAYEFRFTTGTGVDTSL